MDSSSSSAYAPYAPPRSEVADVADGPASFQPVRIWSARGRIGRLRLLAYSTGAYLVAVVIAAVLGGLLGAFGGRGGEVAVMAVSLLPMLAYMVVSFLLLIQRSHDLNLSGWYTLLALIPLVGLVWIFKAGTSGANRYGAPPPPNTLGVKLLGCVLPVFFVVGILAAIALPAYQQYTMKARAAQAR
ncbi:MAG TPA: DUF805 domain-containing protein [Burkholderiaceae bacterium]|nr:DUF805 domain-containing protein [Burkholderiaceae bacterium]